MRSLLRLVLPVLGVVIIIFQLFHLGGGYSGLDSPIWGFLLGAGLIVAPFTALGMLIMYIALVGIPLGLGLLGALIWAELFGKGGWALIGFVAPPIAAVVAGFIFGWRASVSMSFLAVLVPVLGLAILAAHGALQYWVGHDIAVALQLAVIYCLLPAAVASAASTVASSRVAAYAP